MTVRTRFAPSPTGYLHIGGVRTALFNWLFARKHGGQFLLRIDDTDQERNVEAALAPILHGFRWLGLDWDEGPEVGGKHAPYYQSQRLARYQDAAKKLLASGHAYRDYATAEEVAAERAAAEAEKRPFTYSRRWMAETDAQAKAFEAEGRQGVVRLKMPREGSLLIPDLVRGDVSFDWAREQDHVVQRADGTCLYHLASVVDDFDFEITHVIRAEEHLSNTPRQIFIAQSLGYPLPQYAHLPYVAEPGSKNKLSKRKLDKYLKNLDFARVNEHGVSFVRMLRELAAKANTAGVDLAAQLIPKFKELAEKDGKTLSNEELAKAATALAPEYLATYFAKWDGMPQEFLDLFSAEIVGYLQHPEIVPYFRHGRSIWNFTHAEPSPETFNPVIVDFYEQVGYLPDALINYLLLLGWSLDDKTEMFTRDEMIANFSLERVGKSPASFDPKKLWSFQEKYMQQIPAKKKVPRVIPYLQQAGMLADPVPCEIGPVVLQIVEAAGDRIKTYGDILHFAQFFVPDERLFYDEAAFQKSIVQAPGAKELLAKYSAQLATVEPYEVGPLETFTQAFIAAEGKKIGELIHPLRVALTGKAVGLGLFDTLVILGRERSQHRIALAITRAG